MCNLAIASTSEFNWISVDEWECSQEEFVSFYKVAMHLSAELYKAFPEETADTLKVMFLCGNNFGNKRSLMQKE